MLPAVFDESAEQIASSPSALPGFEYEERFNDDLFNQMRDDSDIWLPAGVTYHTDVERLLPNHYLDLDSWEQKRHWPAESPSTYSLEKAAEACHQMLPDIYEELASVYNRATVPLTSGKDSRLLLLSVLETGHTDDFRFFTWGSGTQFDEDARVSKQIAQKFQLTWELYSPPESTGNQREEWLHRTGHAVGGDIMDQAASLQRLDADVITSGLGGEIGRGYYWRESDGPDTQLDATELLDRMHKPSHPKLESVVSNWLSGVSDFDAFTILDLAYQELRVGCWGGPQQLGTTPYLDHVYPLCYRPMVTLFHQLPNEVKRADGFASYVIKDGEPELDSYPYSQLTGWRQAVSLASTAISNPDEAYKFLKRKSRGR
jgi:hypothetical protein